MLTDFDLFKSDHFHRVSSGPFELKPNELLYSDMVLHLPVLEYFASLCDHVTEFGVRDGASTCALIAGCKGDVVSYDVEETPVVAKLKKMILPCRTWNFHRRDTTDPKLEIAPTDLILFDTLHTGAHLEKEIALHAGKARKYLIFHDTFTCGEKDVSGPDPSAPGILAVIRNLQAGKALSVVYETKACNGLLILAV